MPVYQRQLSKGLRWYYKFDFKGKTFKSKSIYHSKGEAKKAEAQAYQEADYRQRHPKQSQEISIQQAINERLDYVHARKTKSYYEDSRRYLSILYHRFNTLTEVTKLDIEKILQEQASRGVYTANAILRAFKAFFNFTIQNHDLDIKNPCQYIKPFAIERRIKYIPTAHEIKRVLEICTSEQQKLIEFLRDTGARLSEALNLTGQDVTELEVILYTRKSANSNLIPRRVPKPNCLRGQTFSPDQKIFGYWKEKPKFLERKLKVLGLPLWGFHNLRHRYASLLSAQGKPLYEVMSLLGHSSLITTQKYLQLIPKLGNDLGTNHTEIMENKELGHPVKN